MSQHWRKMYHVAKDTTKKQFNKVMEESKMSKITDISATRQLLSTIFQPFTLSYILPLQLALRGFCTTNGRNLSLFIVSLICSLTTLVNRPFTEGFQKFCHDYNPEAILHFKGLSLHNLDEGQCDTLQNGQRAHKGEENTSKKMIQYEGEGNQTISTQLGAEMNWQKGK